MGLYPKQVHQQVQDKPYRIIILKLIKLQEKFAIQVKDILITVREKSKPTNFFMIVKLFDLDAT